jgi:hypothetical protein
MLISFLASFYELFVQKFNSCLLYSHKEVGASSGFKASFLWPKNIVPSSSGEESVEVRSHAYHSICTKDCKPLIIVLVLTSAERHPAGQRALIRERVGVVPGESQVDIELD